MVEPLIVIPGFGVFPPEHTCDGADTSPAITVLGARAPYLAVILEDPDASGGTFTHWMVWNIPATERIPGGLPLEGVLSQPVAAVQGMNDAGKIGYSGPCPLRGESHRYLFRVYGLARALDLAPGAGRVELGRAMGDAIREYGEAMAAYGRPAEVEPSRCQGPGSVLPGATGIYDLPHGGAGGAARMQNLTIEVDFDRFPPEHTCDGENLSPRIRVGGSDAPYLAVIVDDPDAPRGMFTHWLAWNIPSTSEIPAGIPPEPRVSHPATAVQGTNDFRRTGYAGPCPPKGASHRFFIRVWGVGRELDLSPGSGRSFLEDALSETATGYGETMAVYERSTVPGASPGSLLRT